ncbi:hypothetical protein [Cohnella fermenti]|uniref:Uncharacterized protein n=1 Tax=Cohnella fermenti TaxID=2565925 RepID=A0A4S4C6A1_9BACL|nr:hypothetical protein [Cohnella fermenti]THF83408.1 hypothetical protein E6C55_04350 [Cohnella fermenti]
MLALLLSVPLIPVSKADAAGVLAVATSTDATALANAIVGSGVQVSNITWQGGSNNCAGN